MTIRHKTEVQVTLLDMNHKELARQLMGAQLIVGGVAATILEAQGYSRKENSDPLYRPLLALPPGSVYCPRRRNAILTLIACRDGGEPGGCILLRTIEVDGAVVQGPGRVSEALGITTHAQQGTLVPHGDDVIELQLGAGTKAPSVPMPPPGGRGIGDETVKRLMPLIVKAYMKSGKGVSFQAYLNKTLAECPTERDLRRRLREQTQG
ncbi:hypothetical protein EPO33_02065 [Patescibacteria group bacterium]|nr:MAG: hypothetical protein EPO33_02065 [Patescibacteria group bacterium]